MVADTSARAPRRPRRASLASVRVRTTALAVIVVGIALAIGSVLLVVLLRGALLEGVETSAEEQAATIAARLSAGVAPSEVTAGDGDELVQLLDASGTVVGAGEDVSDTRALVGPDEDERTVTVRDDDDVERYRVVSEDVEGSGAVRTVVVGQSLEDVTESTNEVTRLLTIGVPLLLLLVGGTTWYVVSRALGPVDRIRREVEEITDTQLHRRVPAPRSQDEVRRLADTMNTMLDRLEVAVQQRRRFVSDASHELRSPVAAIRQSAEVARAHPDAIDGPELIETVLAESTRLERIVQSLLLLARADERSLEVSDRAVDLDDVVLAEARRLRETTQLQVDTSKVSGGQVTGDVAMLSQVLRNLVDNAARHARQRVRLTLSEDAATVILSVEDDGDGIAERDRVRVFERFVRLDDSRARDDGGSGLGLAIVGELLDAHGGEVEIIDSDLGGACFRVTLPSLAGADRS